MQNSSSKGKGILAQPDDEALLVCPPFFSYHLSITEELQKLGFKVTWWNDRASNAAVYKIFLRVAPRLANRLFERLFLNQVTSIPAGSSIKHVLVVKGEGLTPKVIQALRRRLPQARFCYYLWDGIENVKGAVDLAPCFDVVATFDPLDARRFGWAHRPLFSRNAAMPRDAESVSEAVYDWVFIGTIHSDRHKILMRLLKRNGALRTFVFCFMPSKLVWFLRRLTDTSMWLRAKEVAISLESMPAAQVQEVVHQARAIVDIEHPKQRGLTMRTIEALLSERKLITTNIHARGSDLYDPSRVCVIDRRRPVIPPQFLSSGFTSLPAALREKYSLRGWTRDLLTMQRPGSPAPEHGG